MSYFRLLVVAVILIGGIFGTRGIKRLPPPEERQRLADFPWALADWQSEDRPFDAEDAKEIGADDYTNREYFGADRPIELYIGYYRDQSSGDAIHSPKNCLPGSGWEPVRSAQLDIGDQNKSVNVNEYIVEKGMSRDLVLYWYQTRRRIIASEYAVKFWLVADGVRNRSSDGAMVRIWTSADDGEESAQIRAKNFARLIYPEVIDFLPN